MSSTQYKNADIDLTLAVPDTQRRPVPGADTGIMIYAVSIVPATYVDPALPAGAQVKLYFGASGEEIILTTDLVSFDFPCGHDGGIFYSSAVALPTKFLRLLLDYSGGLVNYAR